MARNSNAIRGVIVGTGLAGTRLHLPAYRRVGAEIRAFVDVSGEQARKVASEHGVPAGYASIAEAVENEKVDFVSICTPPETHFELSRQSVLAGCHVLVEKPVASNCQEAGELKQLAMANDRIVAVVHNRRFFKGMLDAENILNSGRIGHVLHVDRQMHFCPETVRMMDPEHWAHTIPGGRFFEANPHSAYLIGRFVQDLEVRHVEIFRRSDRWPHLPITGFSSLLRGKNVQGEDATVTITMSYDNQKVPSRITGTQVTIVHGSKGTMVIDHHAAYVVDDLTSESPSKKWFERRWKGLLTKLRVQPPTHPGGVEHEMIISHFIRQVCGEEKELLVGWDEILEAQKLNDELGRAVQAAVDSLPTLQQTRPA